MRVAIGADWVGFEHKQALLEFVGQLGHQVVDMGGDSAAANDYPDFARRVGETVAQGEADLGILMCGTGIGMSIAANKIRGIRAALCHDAFTVLRARSHNDANILAMGAWVVSIPHAKELVELFLSTSYESGRHVARLQKISDLESSSGVSLK
jgi:ribose 5-phosphate isomerase B